MRDALLLRLCALFFLFALLWVLLGSPIFSDEWQHIPQRLVTIGHQLPLRMARIFLHWH